MTSPDPNDGRPSTREQPSPPRGALEAARESAIALLSDRFANDAFPVEEFEARLAQLSAARSSAELDAAMRDIVQTRTGEAMLVSPAGVDALGGRPSHAPGVNHFAPPTTGRIFAVLAPAQRTGRWVVPQFLDVELVIGEVMIDLREAVIPPTDCEIAVFAALGEVKVLVPPGVVVDDGVSTFLGSVRNDAAFDGQTTPGAVRLRLSGTSVMAEIGVLVAPPGETANRAWRQAKRRKRR
jgi:hypothetical protein